LKGEILMKALGFITIIIIIGFLSFSGCGDKKTDTTETKKQENVNNQQQTQTNQNQTTEKKDTLGTKKEDTTKTADEGSDIVILKTSMGEIEIQLFSKDAPKHAANFKKLVSEKFYDGTTFHRVISGFMIQAGDPNSKNDNRADDGKGGPGYTIPAEIKAKHEKGSVAAARMGDQVNPKRESSGSQFYIVTGEASHLDGQYTVFGKVTKGLDIALKIEKVEKDAADNPLKKVVIEKAYFKKK
jgi:cyclophilin family peptidyl-prolyl cis-trans isomerase